MRKTSSRLQTMEFRRAETSVSSDYWRLETIGTISEGQYSSGKLASLYWQHLLAQNHPSVQGNKWMYQETSLTQEGTHAWATMQRLGVGRNFFSIQDSQAVAAQRGCAVFILESFKVPCGWNPEQRDSVSDLTLLWAEGWTSDLRRSLAAWMVLSLHEGVNMARLPDSLLSMSVWPVKPSEFST